MLSWSRPPRIVAHRGASLAAPENTRAAFEAALRHTTAIELDVHSAADDVPVVVHDGSLARTAGLKRRVRELTSGEIARLSAGAWFGAGFEAERVPTLEAVLTEFGGRALVNVEMKSLDGPYPTLGDAVGRLVVRLGLRDRVLVTSFDPDAVKAFKVSFPEIRAGVVLPYTPSAAEIESFAVFSDALMVVRTSVNEDVVREARRHGLLVAAWTVDDPSEARRLLDLGADCVLSNDPEALAPLNSG